MIIETPRLILRPFELDDAPSIYQYAQDPRVGPIAGWPVHTSVANSRQLIAQYLMRPEIYAVTLKEQPQLAIGSVGLELVANGGGQAFMGPNDAEIGYWIGVPFWGQGLIPEAMQALVTRGFQVLALTNIWCGYYAGNRRSERAQAKLGFQPARTVAALYNPILGDTRQTHFTKLTKAAWQQQDKD